MEMIFNNFDCAIFSAGITVPKEIVLQHINSHTFLIAADAGYKACEQYNIIPNLFVGDYDSSSVPSTNQELIQLNPVKDETDSAYALQIALNRGYKNIVLFGALGGRVDHSFANLELCGYAKNHDASLTILDEHHKIFALKNETACLKEYNKYISIFPLGGACTLTLKGLDYPLNKKTLQPLCGLGISNEMHSDLASIQVENGMALIIIADKD